MADDGPPPADEVNRVWQHGMHEERLFHDRLNYFTGVQVGLLGVFAILFNKEPAPGVLLPVAAVALALALLWLVIQGQCVSGAGRRLLEGTAHARPTV